jgi:hypothetical protein
VIHRDFKPVNIKVREDGTVKVNSLKFNGVTSVDASQLKNALATREQSKVPILGIRL